MCCGEKATNWVRSCDQLGIPVSLNLNKQNVHQTTVGGCCSLLAIFFITFVFYSEITQVIQLNYN